MSSSLPQLPATLDVRKLERLAFLSDVHLHAGDMPTYQAWADYLEHVQADAMFILGDLFEVWVGDDVLSGTEAEFEHRCLQQIKRLSRRMPVYWVAGNRDFLLGPTACSTAGMQALNDPCVLHTANGDWLISHGDALCLADTDYQAFRRMVRSPGWQTQFLATPLHERKQAALEMRAQSQARQSVLTDWADVDTPAAVQWLNQHQATALVHGHTHRPAEHLLAPSLRRYVLSDWSATDKPPRLESFVWQRGRGFERSPLPTTTHH